MGEVVDRLRAARERLDERDLPGALAIYEEILASSGERADVLVTMSGDLGSTGHVAQIIELVAPRYDAERHGPAAGLNLLQAYLAVRDPDAAQHVLDLLFSLGRPDLEERLFGFSNAISELLLETVEAPGGLPASGEPSASPAQVALVTISRPVWSYGLEPILERLLPPKAGRLRKIAFAQLAIPGAFSEGSAFLALPEDELGRLARAIPTWLAEAFTFSEGYAPTVAVPTLDSGGVKGPFHFAAEWTAESLRQMAATDKEPADYAVTGALRHLSGDYELVLRVWEMKKFRERKQFTARWTPATASAELAELLQSLQRFMECAPAAGPGLPYAPPETRPWIDVLGASSLLFLCEKGFVPPALLPPSDALAAESARLAPASEFASLAWLTLDARLRALGRPPQSTPRPALADTPRVVQARQAVGT